MQLSVRNMLVVCTNDLTVKQNWMLSNPLTLFEYTITWSVQVISVISLTRNEKQLNRLGAYRLRTSDNNSLDFVVNRFFMSKNSLRANNSDIFYIRRAWRLWFYLCPFVYHNRITQKVVDEVWRNFSDGIGYVTTKIRLDFDSGDPDRDADSGFLKGFFYHHGYVWYFSVRL